MISVPGNGNNNVYSVSRCCDIRGIGTTGMRQRASNGHIVMRAARSTILRVTFSQL